MVKQPTSFCEGKCFLPGKFATFDCSFKSQILTWESEVPVPKIRPSG